MARSLCIEVEEWRAVPGHGGCFVASSFGRIARTVGSLGANGYQQICFKRSMKPFKASSNGKKWPEQSRGYAHHLVALAFIGPPPEGKNNINHKDGNRANNRPGNLEWCDQADNIRHAWSSGLISKDKGPNITPDQVALIVSLVGEGRSYDEVAKIIGRHP